MADHESRWTHPACDDCWFREHHVDLADGRLQIEMPHRIRELDDDEGRTWEQCCLCGGMTFSGIYIRRDPATLDIWCGQSLAAQAGRS